jgi:hypothetical protein
MSDANKKRHVGAARRRVEDGIMLLIDRLVGKRTILIPFFHIGHATLGNMTSFISKKFDTLHHNVYLPGRAHLGQTGMQRRLSRARARGRRRPCAASAAPAAAAACAASCPGYTAKSAPRR